MDSRLVIIIENGQDKKHVAKALALLAAKIQEKHKRTHRLTGVNFATVGAKGLPPVLARVYPVDFPRWFCEDCAEYFDEPRRVVTQKERRVADPGDSWPEESIDVCPHCGSEDIEEIDQYEPDEIEI